MPHRKLLVSSSLLAAALIPLAASAAGEYHFAPTEAGVTRYPDHAKQDPSRDRVVAELAAVKDDQEFLRGLYHASGLPLPRALLS